MLFDKFKGGRYDIMIAGVPVTKYYAKEYGLDIEIAHILYTTDIIFRLHISKKPAVERMDNALKMLIQNGTVDSIIRRYIN